MEWPAQKTVRAPFRLRYPFPPMLDLNYFRDHLDEMDQMARNRGAVLDLAEFRKNDTVRRALITAAEKLKAERNKGSKEIGNLTQQFMTREDPRIIVLRSRMKQIADEIRQLDERVSGIEDVTRAFLLRVPNVPHKSVPIGAAAAQNVEV